MQLFKKVSNGILLIVIGQMHCHFGISKQGFRFQFKVFAESTYYKISPGLDELLALHSITKF